MSKERVVTLDDATIATADVKKLEGLVMMARACGNDVARRDCETRAIELGRADLIPGDWDAPIAPPATPAPAADTTTALNEPATRLLNDPSLHHELDRRVRVLARELDSDYVDALMRLQAAVQVGRETVAADTSLAGALKRVGVKSLDAFEDDTRMLEQRDTLVARQLDAALVEVSAERVDRQGRVYLDGGFDVSAYLHDTVARERGWRRARELDSAYEDRAAFMDADEAYAEAGLDLVRSLERPRRIAAAHRGAEETREKLDRIIELEQDRTRRTKALDEAASAIAAERESTQRAPVVRTLDQGERVTFAHLDSAGMDRALKMFRERTSATFTLDDAAAAVVGAPATALPASPNIDREQLHEAIAAHRRLHKCSYAEALKHVAGIALDDEVFAPFKLGSSR